MMEALPILLIPGLACSPRLYAGQLPALWRFGPVTVADTRRENTIAGVAQRILATAPPRFALAGLSMGGYIAFEIMRQAPERVAKLALLDSAAGADRPEQTDRRNSQIEMARSGRYFEVFEMLYPLFVHKDRDQDAQLKETVRLMFEDCGADGFINQQKVIMDRPDSRPGLSAIACPTLVLVGAEDALTPPDAARDMAEAIPGANLVIVPDCGHLSTLERPEEVAEALTRWLSS